MEAARNRSGADGSDAERRAADEQRLLAPFLPHSSQQVHELLGGTGVLSPTPRIEDVDDLDGGPAYPILTGDYATEPRWARRTLEPGTPISPPTPLFAKLDPSIVDEELARMENPDDVPAV